MCLWQELSLYGFIDLYPIHFFLGYLIMFNDEPNSSEKLYMLDIKIK